MKQIAFLILSMFLASSAVGQELTFQHFVGSNGGAGSDDGPVTRARLDSPGGVAVDAAGNIYFSDTGYHTVRKITPAGVVTTLAGLAGRAGSADGRGSGAQFMAPRGLAVDGAGTVYVADSLNCTIRRISPIGIVTTVAGKAGEFGYSDGSGDSARFRYPVALAMEASGSVLVADRYGTSVRRVSAEGVVTTLADTMGSPIYFPSPAGVAADAVGNAYVADSYSRTIVKVTPAGVVTTLMDLISRRRG